MEQTIDKRTQIMASTHISGAVMRLALPAIVGMLVMAVYNMADTYFVHLASDSDLEVAAISVYMPILLLTQSISVLFAAGGGAYLSRLLGAKDIRMASATATTTILLSFVSGVIVLILGISFVRPILFAVGASSDTMDMAQEYAVVMLLVAPIQLTNMSFNNLLRAEGNAVRSMIGIVTGSVLNIILDPLFISTLRMGVRGAAVATALAQCVSFVILGSAYWRHHTTAAFSLKGFRFNKRIVGYILRIGLSTFLIEIFTAIGFGIMNAYAKPYGDGVIAALGIVNRLQYLGFAVLFGFTQGYQPVFGYNFGAKRFKLLRTTMVFGISVSMVLGACLVLMYELCGSWLVSLFANGDSVIRIGTELLDWFTIAYPLTGFSLIMLMTYQALGRAVGALVVAVCRQGVCMIPCIMILTQYWGLQGIRMSPLISDIASGIVSLVLALRIFGYIRRERKKNEYATASA